MKGVEPKERNPYLLTLGDRWYRFKVLLALNFDRRTLLAQMMTQSIVQDQPKNRRARLKTCTGRLAPTCRLTG